MDSRITLAIDSDVNQQMADICKKLGMSTSTAFSIFANAFVRANGMPFPVTVLPRSESGSVTVITEEQMEADAAQILEEFADDYKRMAQ